MITNEIKSSLKTAIEKLRIAEDELYRPSEDVATLSVCLIAHQYMRSIMRVFLLSESIEHDEAESLYDLLNHCKAADEEFQSINFNNMFCFELNEPQCDNNYCLSIEKVNNCISIANQVKLHVLNKLKLTELEQSA